MPWTIADDRITEPKNVDAMRDVEPLLDRLVSAYGIRPLADLLGTAPGTIANWKAGRRAISPEMGDRIIALHAVIMRALRRFAPATATRWLVGNEPFLEGARPIDVLVLRGAGPVIAALDAIESGAYG